MWFMRFRPGAATDEHRPLPSPIKTVSWRGNPTPNIPKIAWPALLRRFKRAISGIKPDVIHAGPVNNCGLLTALSGFRPLLLMSWGSDILFQTRNSLLERLIAKYTINRSSMIACDCEAVRDRIIDLTSYPSARIAMFPWGVDLKLFRPTPPTLGIRKRLGWEDNKVIITTRSLEWIYGIDTCLEAINIAVHKDPSLRFIMIGDGSMRPKVEAYIAANGLRESVHLAGRVPHQKLPHYFNEADIYLSCSYSDGTSVSLLEAMACGLPVVVTDIASNREWVSSGRNGWLAPPRDAAAVAAALAQAARSGAEIGRANLALARERADWDKNFNILLGAYQRVAEERAK